MKEPIHADFSDTGAARPPDCKESASESSHLSKQLYTFVYEGNTVTFSQGGIFNRKTKYKFIKSLGEGAFGKTYLFEIIKEGDEILSGPKKIVVKMPLDETAKSLSEKEAKCNLVTTEFGAMDINGNIAYRYKEGVTLCDFYRKIEDQANTVQLFLQMSKSLINSVMRFHKQGWIHRDIKDDNIIIRSFGSIINVDLIDMGLALPVTEGDKKIDIRNLGRTLSEIFERNIAYGSQFKPSMQVSFKLIDLFNEMKGSTGRQPSLAEVFERLSQIEKMVAEEAEKIVASKPDRDSTTITESAPKTSEPSSKHELTKFVYDGHSVTFQQGGLFNHNTKYKCKKLLGSGKRGTTYLFEIVRDGKVKLSGPEKIVVKVPHNSRAKEYSQNEAICNQQTSGFGAIDGNGNIAYEFKEGESVLSCYNSIPDEKNTFQFFLQISKAMINSLMKLHQQQWTHGDICKDNIVVRSIAGGIEADFIDFGSARPLEALYVKKDIRHLGETLYDLYIHKTDLHLKEADPTNKAIQKLIEDMRKKKPDERPSLEEVLEQIAKIETQVTGAEKTDKSELEILPEKSEVGKEEKEPSPKQSSTTTTVDLGTQRSLPESIRPRLGTNKCGLFGDSKRATHPHKPTSTTADSPAGEEAPRKGSSTVMKDLLPGRPTPQPKIRQAGVDAKNFFGSERSTHHPLEPTPAEPIASFSRA